VETQNQYTVILEISTAKYGDRRAWIVNTALIQTSHIPAWITNTCSRHADCYNCTLFLFLSFTKTCSTISWQFTKQSAADRLYDLYENTKTLLWGGRKQHICLAMFYTRLLISLTMHICAIRNSLLHKRPFSIPPAKVGSYFMFGDKPLDGRVIETDICKYGRRCNWLMQSYSYFGMRVQNRYRTSVYLVRSYHVRVSCVLFI